VMKNGQGEEVRDSPEEYLGQGTSEVYLPKKIRKV